MGRTPNHRFSRVKGREVSHLESSLDSIKRRFSRPTAATSIESGRDENSETRGFPVSSAPGPGCSGEKSAHLTSSVGFKRSSNRMSDNNEQLEVADDGDGDGSDSGSHHGNGVGNFSVNAHSHTNGHGSNRRRKRESTESHPNLTLGPFTEATNTTVEKMLEAMEALHTLSDSYKKHGKDIEEIPKIQKKFSHLEEQCKLKDDKIRKQLDTIITLQDIGRDSKETLAQEEQRLIAEKNKLEEGQFELKRQKENAEKRAKAKEAELKIEQNKELEKLKTDLDKEFKGHKEILEKDMEKREENNKEKLVNLEAEKAVLSKELQEQNKKSEEQQEELTKVKDSYEDLTSLKDSLKRDKRDLETKLKIIESEFALDSQTMKF
jgi:DNA repair exonuclease SbcCD ATPase subunit